MKTPDIYIPGQEVIDLPVAEVYKRGLDASHWAYEGANLSFMPRGKRIKEGGLIDVRFSVEVAKVKEVVKFEAEVVKCVKNQHVLIEGEHKYGEPSLTFDLEEDESGATVASFVYQDELARLNGLKRRVALGAINRTLRGEIYPLASQLALKIGGVAVDSPPETKAA